MHMQYYWQNKVKIFFVDFHHLLNFLYFGLKQGSSLFDCILVLILYLFLSRLLTFSSSKITSYLWWWEFWFLLMWRLSRHGKSLIPFTEQPWMEPARYVSVWLHPGMCQSGCLQVRISLVASRYASTWLHTICITLTFEWLCINILFCCL